MAISLSSISKSSLLPPRILLHSAPGIGKSTFAANAEKPIFIQTEDGLSGLPDASTFPLAKSYDEVMEAISALYLEKHEFKTVVLDSADWLEALIYQKVCEDERVDSIEKISFGRGHVFALNYWRNIVDGLNALRNDRDLTTIVLCHTDIKRVSDPTLPEYDTNTLKLHKRASALVEEWADLILFAMVHTNTVTEETGFSGKRIRAVTTGNRILHTVGQPAFLAKSRFSLPPVLPLDWTAFSEALAEARNPSQKAA